MKIKQLMTVSLMGLMAMGSYALPVMADEIEDPSGGQTTDRIESKPMEWRERWENMSPEERAKHKAKREAMREKMKNMTPEEKQAFWKQQREEKLANMTPEERKAFEERRAEMKQRYENMTPEEKEALRKKRHMKWKEKQGEGV